MKTDRKRRKFNSSFSAESRKRKDRIIKAMVLCIIAFITLLLISEMA